MPDGSDRHYPQPPAHVETYVRILGCELAVDFLMAFGGAQLYIAPNPKKRSRLSALVGPEKARALAGVSDHLPARVPTAKPWIAGVMRSKGLPVSEIARTLHVSDVSVRSWLKKQLGDPRQQSLF